MLHGGRLDAAGNFGVGSQFRFVFPREQDAGPFDVAQSPLPLAAPVAEDGDDDDLILEATPAQAQPDDPEARQ